MIGTVAAVGFTVALFVTSVALSNGVSPEAALEYAKYGTADMLRLGALLSFATGPILAIRQMLKVADMLKIASPQFQ